MFRFIFLSNLSIYVDRKGLRQYLFLQLFASKTKREREKETILPEARD